MQKDTAKVSGRRQLHFASYDDLLADARRLACGPATALGNWSAGQVFQHLAHTMTMSLDGVDFRAPWFVRLVAGRLLKNRFLNRPMSAGFRLPRRAASLLPPPTETETGLAALQAAIARLQAEPQRRPHPALGPLTRDEWDRLHFRHAELHLSFLVPAGQ